jgi:hypothetical protein
MQRLLTVLLLLTISATTAAAQATRTWVSGVGSDANPCSRTAPCQTFAGAISKTLDDGEIDVLDPGGFGVVTIMNRGITIDGQGSLASILASGVNAININAPGQKVFLRNLAIQGIGASGPMGAPTGLDAIRVIQAAEVHVEDCVIENFSRFAIDVEGASAVYVKNTTIHNAVEGAIRVQPTGGPARVVLENVKLSTSGFGLFVAAGSKVTVRDSTATGNTGPGFWASGAGSELTLVHAVSAHNQLGVRASEGALVRTLDLVAVDNTNDGLSTETNGAIVGYTGNLLAGNGTSLAACELADEGAPPVACPDVAPVCPEPVCPTPELTNAVQNCKRCKTRNGVTTCKGCTVGIQ